MDRYDQFNTNNCRSFQNEDNHGSFSNWNSSRRGRSGRRGYSGNRGGRGAKQPPDPSKPRAPAHLRGKDIGLWYARNSRGSKVQRENRDIGDRAVISLPLQEGINLERLLDGVKEKNSREDGPSSSGRSRNDGTHSHSVYSTGKDKYMFSGSPLIRDPIKDSELYDQSQVDVSTMTNSKAYENILSFRRQLPSFKMRDEILEMINSNQVSLISGETGCGKTTQVAQFILDDYISKRCGSMCHIICTQPRRISAISVAERVAAERNEKLGNSVGYQIRLEHKQPRKQGSILFCTLGVLLRFMINDRNITMASHIIIDEIHERDTLSDFLLIVIKDLLPFRPDLKVILMSATLNAEIFSKYFNNCPRLEIPGSAFAVEDHYLEDILDDLSYTPSTQKPRRADHWRRRNVDELQEEYFEYLKTIECRYPPNVTSRLREMQFDKIDNDLIMSVLMYINKISDDGAVLVFLPGWQDISNLHKSLTQSRMFSNPHKFLVIPLHSRLPTVSQREVFDRPPAGCRKIIIATNIAETSITIDDVVYVVDCGKARETNFNTELNVASLDSKWISKASEKQRRGRAGRVQNGHCFHLFTKFHRSTFREFQLPEMLRTPLDSLCLQIKILKLGRMWEFLCKAIEPPKQEMCEKAIKDLIQMRALDEHENLTSLGYHLAVLPVSPKIGRMILFGAIFSCLDPILTVAASLDSKDPFFAPLGKEKEADRQKRLLARGSKSDHIALINAFNGWKEQNGYQAESEYCWHYFLSMNHLKFIAGMKTQFTDLLVSIGFVEPRSSSNKNFANSNVNSENMSLVKAVICAGLYPNVAKVEYNVRGTRIQNIITVGDQENLRVGLHPKSVNGEEKDFESQWLVYHEKMKLTKVYLFDSTMISPYPLLFFGGKIRYHVEGGQETIEVDEGIKFHSSIRTAKLVIELREELDRLLGKKIRNPKMKLIVGKTEEQSDEDILKAIIGLITTEKVLPKRFFDTFGN